jgi:hypothetical protein
LKLFVWNNPIGIENGGSCLYVVAETEDLAREQIKETRFSRFGGPYDDESLSSLFTPA